PRMPGQAGEPRDAPEQDPGASQELRHRPDGHRHAEAFGPLPADRDQNPGRTAAPQHPHSPPCPSGPRSGTNKNPPHEAVRRVMPLVDRAGIEPATTAFSVPPGRLPLTSARVQNQLHDSVSGSWNLPPMS